MPTSCLSLLSARLWHRPWTLCLRSSWGRLPSVRALDRAPTTPQAPGLAARSLQAVGAWARTKASRGALVPRPHPRPPIPRAWTHSSSHTEGPPHPLQALPQPRARLAGCPQPFASPWPCPAYLLVTLCREEEVASPAPRFLPRSGLGPSGRPPRREAGGRSLLALGVRARGWLSPLTASRWRVPLLS